MAENIPSLPTGAAPPKPAEAAKVQPKKETVRINLPPKPAATPGVRIPGPAAQAPPPPAAAPAPAPPPPAAAPVARPAAPVAAPVGAPVAAPVARPPAPVAAAQPAATLGGLDKVLCIVAAVVAVGVLAVVARLITLFPK
jgi:hypothetical protein